MTLDKILQETTLFENYRGKSYDELLASLKIAEVNIIARLAKTKGEWTSKRLIEMRKLIDQEIQFAYGGLFSNLQDEGIAVANIAYGFMISELGKDIPVSLAKEIVNSNRLIQMSEDKAYTFKDLFKLNEVNHSKSLKVLLSAGVNQGRSIDGIISDFGIKSDKLTRANIRTDINTFIGQTRMDAKVKSFSQLEKTGVVRGYEYNAVLDSGTTLYCRKLDSKRYYQPIAEIRHLIKVHANCRSEFTIITDNEVENKRASQFGETNKGYEDWFLEQSKEFQRSNLTNRQYESFLKGNYKVKNLSDITKVKSLAGIEKTLKGI